MIVHFVVADKRVAGIAQQNTRASCSRNRLQPGMSEADDRWRCAKKKRSHDS